MNDYTLVTVCSRKPTETYFVLDQWFQTTEGTNRLVIDYIDEPYQSLCDKPKYLYKAIKRGIISSKYIIFCDCFDLIFATTPEEMIDKFENNFDHPDLIISAERNCFPDTYRKEYDTLVSNTSYKYLNSGMIVGYTDALLTTLEAMKVEEIPKDYYDPELRRNVHFNDQEYFQKIFLDQPVNIALDRNQILCGTYHSVTLDDLDFSEARIRNKETGSYPCAHHMNGNSKTENGIRPAILKHLNLL